MEFSLILKCLSIRFCSVHLPYSECLHRSVVIVARSLTPKDVTSFVGTRYKAPEMVLSAAGGWYLSNFMLSSLIALIGIMLFEMMLSVQIVSFSFHILPLMY